MPQTIIVLDFGSQYTQVIARRIREANVYSKVLPYNTPKSVIKKQNPIGIVLSGEPARVLPKGAPKPKPAAKVDQGKIDTLTREKKKLE